MVNLVENGRKLETTQREITRTKLQAILKNLHFADNQKNKSLVKVSKFDLL